MRAATADEIADLLGERAEEVVVERIADLGVSLDEVAEALEDFEHQLEYGEEREPSSPRVEDVRIVLEELVEQRPAPIPATDDDDDEHEGLTVIDPEELGREPQ
jgi:hypothetical protein